MRSIVTVLLVGFALCGSRIEAQEATFAANMATEASVLGCKYCMDFGGYGWCEDGGGIGHAVCAHTEGACSAWGDCGPTLRSIDGTVLVSNTDELERVSSHSGERTYLTSCGGIAWRSYSEDEAARVTNSARLIEI